MGYEHTQRGPWRWIGYAIVVALVPVLWQVADEPVAVVLIAGGAALIMVTTEGFSRLTIRDDGDRLGVYFGPPPIARTQIAYRDIDTVEADRSTFLDGWGIHWTPGRGVIYNVWGYDCVRITADRRVIRLGTDDVDTLVAFLTAKRYEYRAAPLTSDS